MIRRIDYLFLLVLRWHFSGKRRWDCPNNSVSFEGLWRRHSIRWACGQSDFSSSVWLHRKHPPQSWLWTKQHRRQHRWEWSLCIVVKANPINSFTYCLCSFFTASFLYKNIIEGHINYVQSRHQKMEPTADQFLLCVSDGKHSSAHVPFYIIINPTNDESPEFLAHNITVSWYNVDLTPEGCHNSETFCSDFVLIAYVDINWLGSLCQEVQEGKMKNLDSSVLRAVDLDVPKNVLLFTIVHPPQHGSILHRVDGKLTKRQEANLQSSVLDFTMADLTNGNLFSILKELK